MKNYILLTLCASLLFSGCEKDDGFRALTIEIDLGAVSTPSNINYYNYAFAGVQLNSEDPDTELLLIAEHESGDSKRTYTSDAKSWAVGSNVRHQVQVGGLTDNNEGLPCDAKILIKADNKVIWSYNGKKGDNTYYYDVNLIIR